MLHETNYNTGFESVPNFFYMDEIKLNPQQLQGLFTAFKNEHIEPMKNNMLELLEGVKKNQQFIDNAAAIMQKRPANFSNKKTLGEAIADELQTKQAEIKELQANKNFKFSFELKTSGVLLGNDGHLTGDPQAIYSVPAIAPRQAINFRDLIPTVASPTGTLIFYQEGAVTNSVATQTEGQAKAAQDYTWAEKKATSSYLAARTKFSKQMMYNLPFLQNTLTLELTRDFYKAENNLFFVTVAVAATGTNPATVAGAATDIEEILSGISNQLKANFVPSFVLIDPTEWYRILTTAKADYTLPAGTVVSAGGIITVAGVPVIPVSWAQSDHYLICDANYLQRVETESIRVEFAFTNEDDWIKNLICARIECFETINLTRPESAIYHDMGNS